MSTSLKQRLVVALLLTFSSAVMSSSILKPFALVCYAIALLAIISALILAITNVPPQQRKLTLILVPITILVCGVGGYLLSKFLSAR
jgi:4-amino-4-deoxy-L-arabinose transferase-like glycosyltransferase